ncbi:MAG: histidine kinase [Bacillota bacterium]|nr:histidine kinase [Bacillota bacterium]
MKDKLEHYLIIIIYIVLVISLIFCAIENISSPWKSLYISLAIIASFTVKQLFIQLKYQNNPVFYLLIAADIVMTLYLSAATNGTSFRMFYFVIMYEVIFSIKEAKAALICTSFYMMDIAANYYKMGHTNTAAFFKFELYNFPEYLLVSVVLFLVKYIIDINHNLFEVQRNLEVSNVELNETYKNLKDAYKKNEDYLIIQEKNKLARSIHDTVGHTLTTALVEMEASKILMEDYISKTKNISKTNTILEKSSQKLEAAVSQVRKGLNEVRNSVSALGSKDTDYYKEIINLINDVKKHTDIKIIHDIDHIDGENIELKKCIFRALQEGITNSIRHGGASAIVFKLKNREDCLFFSLEDNGKGCCFYKKGFGLSAMEERVQESGGDLQIMTQPHEGFNIYIKFHKIGEQNDKNNNC